MREMLLVVSDFVYPGQNVRIMRDCKKTQKSINLTNKTHLRIDKVCKTNGGYHFAISFASTFLISKQRLFLNISFRHFCHKFEIKMTVGIILGSSPCGVFTKLKNKSDECEVVR